MNNFGDYGFYRVRYLHRHFSGLNRKEKKNLLEFTIAYTLTDNNTVRLGFSYVNPADNFNKAMGRTAANCSLYCFPSHYSLEFSLSDLWSEKVMLMELPSQPTRGKFKQNLYDFGVISEICRNITRDVSKLYMQNQIP